MELYLNENKDGEVKYGSILNGKNFGTIIFIRID